MLSSLPMDHVEIHPLFFKGVPHEEPTSRSAKSTNQLHILT